MKEDFEVENAYLQTVYQELLAVQATANELLAETNRTAVNAKREFSGDSTANFSSITESLDMYAEIEQKNREIDQFNIKADTTFKQLEKAKRLLPRAYFGKISLDFLDDEPLEDFYIGTTSFTNDADENRVYDWRSPIAEVYYNQASGVTSYEANGHQIEVELQKRRQFDIKEDQLINYFDAAIAIEDELLLQSLAENSLAQMQNITETIQKEQNVIIRDTQSDVLLVNGIAGSGKTSAVLQRIAYLLYRYRADVNQDNIVLMTPNEVFANYIASVLPSMGEKNPTEYTIGQLVQHLLPPRFHVETEHTYLDRISTGSVSAENQVYQSAEFMAAMQAQTNSLVVTELDFRPIKNEFGMFTPAQIFAVYEKTAATQTVRMRLEGVRKSLESAWETQLLHLANSVEMLNELEALTEAEQNQFFGKRIELDDANLNKFATAYLKQKYQAIGRAIQRFHWVAIENIVEQAFAAFTGQTASITPRAITVDQGIAILHALNLFVVAHENKRVKFVLIDEVQDYTPAQIMLISQIFPRARFTLLGDENQAIFNTNIEFDELARLFDNGRRQLTRRDLLTSYRSNGPITKLFAHLARGERKLQIAPIQAKGYEPIVMNTTASSYQAELVALLSEVDLTETTVIVTKDLAEAQALFTALHEQVALELVDTDSGHLAGQGVKIIALTLAKGLEFDNVIIHDASAQRFQTDYDRRALYTAISRAMKRVYLPYVDELTPLLKIVNEKN